MLSGYTMPGSWPAVAVPLVVAHRDPQTKRPVHLVYVVQTLTQAARVALPAAVWWRRYMPGATPWNASVPASIYSRILQETAHPVLDPAAVTEDRLKASSGPGAKAAKRRSQARATSENQADMYHGCSNVAPPMSRTVLQ